jgi:hypothetical protein
MDDALYVVYVLELSALPDVKLLLHAFHLFDETGAKA